MRTRLVALAATAGLAAAVLPAHAATSPKPQIVDPTGDANGINQQFPGLGPNPPTVSTAPADVAGADITSVLLKTNFVTKRVRGRSVKVANGFTVTLTLAAATVPQMEYRVAMAGGNCDDIFFEYDSAAGLGGSDARCPATNPLDEIDYGITASVSGNKISWVVPAGLFRVGSAFTSLNAQTRTILGAVTAPQLDYAQSAATFVYGK